MNEKHSFKKMSQDTFSLSRHFYMTAKIFDWWLNTFAQLNAKATIYTVNRFRFSVGKLCIGREYFFSFSCRCLLKYDGSFTIVEAYLKWIKKIISFGSFIKRIYIILVMSQQQGLEDDNKHWINMIATFQVIELFK